MDVLAFRSLVYCTARSLCKQGYGEHDDIAQDLWLALVQSAKQYDPAKGSPRAFAKKVIAMAVLDITRRAANTDRVRAQSDLHGLHDSMSAEIEHHREIDDAVRRAWLTMPQEIRIVCTLLREGKSQDQIAEQLGISRRTVRRRMNVAKEYLARAGIGNTP